MLPRERIDEAVTRYGRDTLAQWCAGLLSGQIAPGDPDWPPLTSLGGQHATLFERGHPEYWARVWAARGFLYVWRDDAAPAVVAALADPAWRVREMAAKVARLREIGEAADALAVIVDDETPRVRRAALRALARVGEAEHAVAIRRAAALDPATAEHALWELGLRLDRELPVDDELG